MLLEQMNNLGNNFLVSESHDPMMQTICKWALEAYSAAGTISFAPVHVSKATSPLSPREHFHR